MAAPGSPFLVGMTRDAMAPGGGLVFGDHCLAILDAAPGVEREFIARDEAVLPADVVRRYDAILNFSGNAIADTSLTGAQRLKLVARVGVGYDTIDVNACTRHGVLVTITPSAVRRPMASGAVAFILALTHRLPEKDALTRSGGWARRQELIGMGLAGRTIGIVGLGNIGREVLALLRPFEMRAIAYGPRLTAATAAAAGAEAVSLETLLRESDVVCVACPLRPETHHLLSAERLGLMRAGAYLVNVSRGAVIDQQALVAALRSGRIAGAGLDVFEEEPLPDDDPLLMLDNVVVAPHAIGFTDQLFGESIASACRSIVAVASGRAPEDALNPDAAAARAAGSTPSVVS